MGWGGMLQWRAGRGYPSSFCELSMGDEHDTACLSEVTHSWVATTTHSWVSDATHEWGTLET